MKVLSVLFLLFGAAAASCSLAAGEVSTSFEYAAGTGYTLKLEYASLTSASFIEGTDILSDMTAATPDDVNCDAKVETYATLSALHSATGAILTSSDEGYVLSATLTVVAETTSSTSSRLNSGDDVTLTSTYSIDIKANIATSLTFVTPATTSVYPDANLESATTVIEYNRGTKQIAIDFVIAIQEAYKVSAAHVTGKESSSATDDSNGNAQTCQSGSQTSLLCIINWISATYSDSTLNCETTPEFSFSDTVTTTFTITERYNNLGTETQTHTTTIKSGNVCEKSASQNVFGSIDGLPSTHLYLEDSSVCDESTTNSFYLGDKFCVKQALANADFLTVTSISASATIDSNSFTGVSVVDGWKSDSSNIYVLFSSGFPVALDTETDRDSLIYDSETISVTLTATLDVTPARRLRLLVEDSSNSNLNFDAEVGSVLAGVRPGTVGTTNLLRGGESAAASAPSKQEGLPSWAIALIVIAAAALSAMLVMKVLKSYKSYRAVAKVTQNSYSAPTPTVQSSA